MIAKLRACEQAIAAGVDELPEREGGGRKTAGDSHPLSGELTDHLSQRRILAADLLDACARRAVPYVTLEPLEAAESARARDSLRVIRDLLVQINDYPYEGNLGVPVERSVVVETVIPTPLSATTC